MVIVTSAIPGRAANSARYPGVVGPLPQLSVAAISGESARVSSNEAPIRDAAERMARQAAIAMERAETRGQRAEARQLERAAVWLARSCSRPPGRRRRSPREAQEIIRAVFAARPSEAFLTKEPLRDHPSQPAHAAQHRRN
jgi:hypothetical protein